MQQRVHHAGQEAREVDLAEQQTGAPATSGNVLGDKTKLQANRKVEEITGNPGEGPSEMETTHSPEGKQQAARAYKDNYQKYKKMSEDVLDSEPIPLGHRQTIRKYFELIRPAGGRFGRLLEGRPGRARQEVSPTSGDSY